MSRPGDPSHNMHSAFLALALWMAAGPLFAADDALLEQGRTVFRSRCAVCHGMQADGHSNLARIMRPPPANLRASVLNDEAQSNIVRLGGASQGRSPNMPEWRLELQEAEIVAVLAYIRSVKDSPP